MNTNLFPALGQRRSSAFEAMGRTAFDGPAQVRRVLNGQLPSTYAAQRPQLVPDPRTMGGPDSMFNRKADQFIEGNFAPNGRVQSDPGLADSTAELNVKLIIDPRTSRGNISFSSDEYLCLSTCASDRNPKSTSVADLANRVVGFTQMNADWRAAFDRRKQIIHNNMESVVDVRSRANHAAPGTVRNTMMHSDTSNPADPTWVTRVSDFTEKYNCLGPYVSTDSVAGATSNGGFKTPSDSGTVVVSVKFVGEQLNIPNVFGQETRHAHVGFCIGARQNLDTRLHPEQQAEQPIQWTPWMSAVYSRPFLESNPEEMIMATAHPGQKQRTLGVMRLGAVHNGVPRSTVSFLSDLSRTTDQKAIHMRDHEYMNTDLAYRALDVVRDPETGTLQYQWRYETAFFVMMGDSKLTRGKGRATVTDLWRLLDNPSAYAERSHKSTVSVRMVK